MGPPGMDEPMPPGACGPAGPSALQLDWSAHDAYGQGDAYAAVPGRGEGFGKAASLCIGSRQCQKARGDAGDKGLMCPSFRITQDDLHSTRGRAAALREALDGELAPGGTAGLAAAATSPLWDAAAAQRLDAAMELCVACKGCKRECPNGIDMAALRAETLAQRWHRQRPPWRTRFFAALPLHLPRLRPLRSLLVWRDRLPWVARLGERLTGIAAARSLPRLAARPFLDRPTPTPLPQAGPAREVVLLVDCFANHLDPEVAEAAVVVLQAAGLRVHLLRAADGGALCCGRTAFSAGLVDEARAHAGRLLQALEPHLDAGRAVIGLEPSCLTMLRDEVHLLRLPPGSVKKLERQVFLMEEFLVREHDARRLALPWRALERTVHVHGHCHQKAFGTLKAMRKLLGLVPGLQVQWIESSCCGMAGSFGYEAEHHAASMRMGELALLPAVRAAAPDDLILASGTSCRHQIRDGAGREAVHLALLLRAALSPSPSPSPSPSLPDGPAVAPAAVSP